MKLRPVSMLRHRPKDANISVKYFTEEACMGIDDKGREMVMVDVWDWETRVLHWVNALLVITLALLMVGNEVMEGLGVAKPLRRPVKELHTYLGYFFVATFSLRILWALVGNKYARWGDIIPCSREKRCAQRQ